MCRGLGRGDNDHTVAVAERCGARVVQFRQNGPWPKKKNWALENVPLYV